MGDQSSSWVDDMSDNKVLVGKVGWVLNGHYNGGRQEVDSGGFEL